MGTSVHRRLAAPSLAALLAAAAVPAHAGGGAHIVDDAEVQEPGECQVEGWATFARGARLAVVAPSCTPGDAPRFDVGAELSYSREGGDRDVVLGPTVKYALLPARRGVAVALSGAAGISVVDRRLGSASLVMPVTFDLDPRLRLNLNAGWAWTRGAVGHRATWGAQIVHEASEQLLVMAEAFVGDTGEKGLQTGLRWTPPGARFDVDLLYRADRDGGIGEAVTFGLTFRR
ncbi:MAG: hypothetical protein ACK4K7_15340 [Allosphingosinicella sp.]|uniref:hypothetical protein n=1 Tax=Allosphingosinicella sp. TaxID=2823234 RepID=UPI003920E2E4